jgi:hypothetical protein
MSSNRDLVFICFCREDQRTIDFRDELRTQLDAVKSNGKIGDFDFFDDEQISPGSDWRRRILDALRRTRVALLLEGPGFMASSFVMKAEVPKFLNDARLDGVTLFRVPVKKYATSVVPAELEKLQFGWTGKPLGELTHARRMGANARIIDSIVKAYGRTPAPDDELDEPPFTVAGYTEHRNLIVYPERVAAWARAPGFAELHAPLCDEFVNWLATKLQPITPLWRLSLPKRDVAALTATLRKNENEIKALEIVVAKLYPRFRDAHIALLSCLHDGQRNFSRDNLKHAKGVMRSLCRKNGDFWKPLSNSIAIGALEQFDDYVTACQCIPICMLGILQRLDYACEQPHADVSLNMSYLCLDRMCHWLLMLHRLLNLALDQGANSPRVIGVP